MHSTTSNHSRLPSEQSAAPPFASPGTGQLPRKPPPRSSSARSARYRRRVITSLLLLLVLVLLLVGGAVFSLGSGLAFFAPGATVTLTPRSTQQQQNITIQAVAGTPHQGQAQARVLTSGTQTASSTAPATGNGQQNAQAARGQVTFYNLATYPITIQAEITLTGKDGVQVKTDAATQVPAGNPPVMGSASVPAHAVSPGPGGNIAAGDIDVLCCADGIVVKNQQAFGGGQIARSFTAVAQADIDAARAPLSARLTQEAQADLSAQARPGEKLFSMPCVTEVQANPPLGHEASQVTVSVSVTCRGVTYFAQQVDSLAAALFQQQERAALGAHYTLAGQITASVQQAGITQPQPGTLAIPVAVRGLWIYQVDRSAFRALAKQLAGKDPAAARATLLRVPGVAQVSIQLSGWNVSALPTDISQIEIVVASAPKP